MLSAFSRHVVQRSCGQIRTSAGTLQLFKSFASDSHDDFKPQYKEQAATSSAIDTIETDLKSHKVFVYMKGVPEAPMCGFSNAACRILDAYGVRYGSRNVLADPEIRDAIKTYSSWPTIPQVFIDGELLGGSDILMDMHKSGELLNVVEKLQAEEAQGGK